MTLDAESEYKAWRNGDLNVLEALVREEPEFLPNRRKAPETHVVKWFDPLELVCLDAHLPALRLLLAHPKIQLQPNESHDRPYVVVLAEAVLWKICGTRNNDRAEMLRLLIDRGFEWDSACKPYGENALAVLLEKESNSQPFHHEMIDVLFERSRGLEKTQRALFFAGGVRCKVQPLCLAAHAGDLPMVKRLVAEGVHLDHPGVYGTALTCAAARLEFDTMDYLLSLGADPTVKLKEKGNCSDYTALVWLAKHANNFDKSLFLRYKAEQAALELLLRFPDRVEAMGGKEALFWSSIKPGSPLHQALHKAIKGCTAVRRSNVVFFSKCKGQKISLNRRAWFHYHVISKLQHKGEN